MFDLFIDERQLVPTRVIPYMTGWSISPDVLVKMLSNSDKWNRVFIPSYHLLPDGRYKRMLPKEWDVFVADLEILSDKLHHEESFEQENYPVWRQQSIAHLPAATFVWMDELEEAYRRTESRIVRPNERPGDRGLAYSPLIPPDLKAIVFEGFETKGIESPAQRQSRLKRWLDEELKVGERGAIERVALREDISRQRVSQILNKKY